MTGCTIVGMKIRAIDEAYQRDDDGVFVPTTNAICHPQENLVDKHTNMLI